MKILTSEKITTPIGTLQQCNLSPCVEDQFGGEKKVYKGVTQNTYQVDIAFSKDDKRTKPFIENLNRIQKELGQRKFGERFKPKHPLIRSSEDLDSKFVIENSYILRAKRRCPADNPPLITLCDKDGSRVLDLGKFYAGCKARLQIALRTYDHGGLKGVNAQLLTIQFCGDGEPLFAGSLSGDELGAVDDFDSMSNNSLHDDMLAA